MPQKFRAVIPASALGGLMLIAAVLYSALLPARGYELPIALVPIDLEATDVEPPPGQVVLHLSEHESFLNGVPVAPNALEVPLRASLAGQAEPVVVLDAADDTPYGEIVAMLETIHAAGGNFVALAPNIAAFLQANGNGASTAKHDVAPGSRPSIDKQLEENP